jgi:hypothetical protein
MHARAELTALPQLCAPRKAESATAAQKKRSVFSASRITIWSGWKVKKSGFIVAGIRYKSVSIEKTATKIV